MTFVSKKSGLNVVDEPVYQSEVSTDGAMVADSDNLIPTQRAVVTYVSSGLVGIVDDRGTYDPTITSLWPVTGGRGVGGLPIKGDMWEASASGTMNGTNIETGWWFRALVDTPGQTAGNWAISVSQITYTDVINALGYTPYNATNPSGYITSGYVFDAANNNTVAVPQTSSSDISAAGTNQATATILTKAKNRIDTVALGTGVVNNSTATVGFDRTVQNNGANDLLWYPFGTNQFYQIGTGLLGAGTPITIAAGNQARVFCYDAGQLTLI